MNDERINWVNGIWEDGEWVSWDFSDCDADDEWDPYEETYTHDPSIPATTLQLWELIGVIIELAKTYFRVTGRHLPVYGELGELYGEAKFGIKRHNPNTPGSDGKLGNDFVEIKTISPHKSTNTVSAKRSGNFNKLLVVKITPEFKIRSKMFLRKNLGKGSGKYTRATFNE